MTIGEFFGNPVCPALLVFDGNSYFVQSKYTPLGDGEFVVCQLDGVWDFCEQLGDCAYPETELTEGELNNILDDWRAEACARAER